MFQDISPEDAQPMERSLWSVERSTTFTEVCRSGRNRTIHDLEQELDQHHEEADDTVSTVYFKNKHLVITANPKTLSNEASIIVSYKGDTGSA